MDLIFYDTSLTLVMARVVQGGAAALMASQVLTGIQLNFEGTVRARALGVYTALMAGSAVVGQILGGVLIGADLFLPRRPCLAARQARPWRRGRAVGGPPAAVLPLMWGLAGVDIGQTWPRAPRPSGSSWSSSSE